MDYGERIIDLLFLIDQRLIYARGQYRIAKIDYRTFSKKGSQYDIQRAMNAKINKECFKDMINKLEKLKADTNSEILQLLDVYLPQHKELWIDVFINNMSISDLSKKYNESEEQINKTIMFLKRDIKKLFKDL